MPLPSEPRGLPSAPAPSNMITHHCPACGYVQSCQEGERLQPCKCRSLPLSEQFPPDVYQLISETKGPEFVAIGLPPEGRPIEVFGHTSQDVEDRCKKMMDL